MASIKVVLRKNMMKKDGTIPLALRISENYKTNYKWLGQYVLEKDWDKVVGKVKRTHPNYRKLNNFLMKKLTEANDVYFDSKDESITPKVNMIEELFRWPNQSFQFYIIWRSSFLSNLLFRRMKLLKESNREERIGLVRPVNQNIHFWLESTISRKTKI